MSKPIRDAEPAAQDRVGDRMDSESERTGWLLVGRL
jgi:hypothetical protein